MRARIAWWTWVLLGLGCGSSAPAHVNREIPAASAGDEASPQPSADDAAPPPTAANVPSRPASIAVRALVDGKPVPAHVRELDGEGVRGESGEAIALPAGHHRVAVQISDRAALVDQPTQLLDVHLEPGQQAQVDAVFPWSKVQLNVMVGGRVQPGVRVNLLRNSSVVAQLQSGAAPVLVSPGKYEADVLRRGQSIHVTGLLFMDSAAQVVPVRVHE